ncbi:MAG: pyridoxamine 5'-phosphate oxidase family protein [Geobacter sp.]|nr:MAG: pyridoxamine 5'-phosphate oxidase family protein [Geobacter sp.]
MMNFDPLREKLRKLFSVVQLAVLATEHDGSPYASLVAFAASDDLREIYFATDRETRKYRYLQENGRVAFLVDNRSKTGGDFQEGIAVTVLGMATELQDAERESALAAYIANLPGLAEFVSSPSCALFRVTVSSYSLVEEFKKISEFRFDG